MDGWGEGRAGNKEKRGLAMREQADRGMGSAFGFKREKDILQWKVQNRIRATKI